MVCEKCGSVITDYRMAGVVWDRAFLNDGREQSNVIVLCKTNGCLTAPPYDRHFWMEVRTYFLWLLQNSGLKTEAQMHKEWERTQRWRD